MEQSKIFHENILISRNYKVIRSENKAYVTDSYNENTYIKINKCMINSQLKAYRFICKVSEVNTIRSEFYANFNDIIIEGKIIDENISNLSLELTNYLIRTNPVAVSIFRDYTRRK